MHDLLPVYIISGIDFFSFWQVLHNFRAAIVAKAMALFLSVQGITFSSALHINNARASNEVLSVAMFFVILCNVVDQSIKLTLLG